VIFLHYAQGSSSTRDHAGEWEVMGKKEVEEKMQGRWGLGASRFPFNHIDVL
jgi:hypothetical protein